MTSLAGKADNELFGKVVEANASASQVGQAVARIAGKTGRMIFAEIPQGPLLSLVGRKKKATLFLIGNPLIANEMFEEDPGVGLYAPLRLLVFSDHRGGTHVDMTNDFSFLE